MASSRKTQNYVILSLSGIPHVEKARAELLQVLEKQKHLKIFSCSCSTTEQVDISWKKMDLAVVLGGDGAILRACRQMGKDQIPIVGVNLGRLGFLADLSPQEFQVCLPNLIAGEYRVVEHLMYRCVLKRKGTKDQIWLGLNEVTVLAGASMKMIDVNLSIDGELVTTYSGDGVIVSTPVGSTAHSLSAGGPILRQDLQAFVITPICPHALTMRPVVDSAQRRYSLQVPSIPAGVNLVMDGQIHIPLQSGDIIEVTNAAPIQFQRVQVPGHSYYGTLHRKLNWGGQPNYRPR